MKINLIKKLDQSLCAYDEDSLDLLKSIPANYFFNVTYSPARNYKNHKRWFDFVNKTFDIQDNYTDKDTWRGVLQIYGGHCKHVTTPSGETHTWPESISFDVLDDELKFRNMFKRALDMFLKKHCKSMTDEDFMRIMDYE